MYSTWWFEVVTEGSDLEGAQFFVEVYTTLDKAKVEATKIAQEVYPDEELRCYGRVSGIEAERMGLDTY